MRLVAGEQVEIPYRLDDRDLILVPGRFLRRPLQESSKFRAVLELFEGRVVLVCPPSELERLGEVSDGGLSPAPVMARRETTEPGGDQARVPGRLAQVERLANVLDAHDGKIPRLAESDGDERGERLCAASGDDDSRTVGQHLHA